MSYFRKIINRVKRLVSPNNSEEVRLFDFDYENQTLELDSIDVYIERYKSVFEESDEINKRYKETKNAFAMYQKFVSIGDAKLERLILTVRNFNNIENEREGFHIRMNKVGKEYDYIAQYETEFQKIISDIQDKEQSNRLLRSDLNILDVEKNNLVHREFVLARTRKIIDYMMIGMVIAFSMFSAVLLAQAAYQKQAILMPSLIMTCITIFFIVWLFIFRRYTIFEQKKNKLLQNRAVQLSNKTKIKYVSNESTLDYSYKKYKTYSSEQLVHQMEQYQNYKKDLERFQYLCRNESAAYEDIVRMLEKYHLGEYQDYLDNHRNEFLDSKQIHENLKRQEREFKFQTERFNKNQKEVDFISNIMLSFIEKQPEQSKQVIYKKLEVNGIRLDKHSLIV